ncbi:MAG: hypothetical protein WBB52_09190 [Acidimicrobiales bacterium]|jgi:2-polyprenyl-6-methoxyphenol hydroxylase-like FAD-dependent oxidoreductase
MSIYVHYNVPLVAEIEVAAGEVVAVHLDDEAIEGPLAVTADGGNPPSEVRQEAIRIAESEMWPGWVPGW